MAISEYRTRRRVEFSDTDAGGIVHFARFFVFMEICEHEMLRSLGVDPGAGPRPDGRLIGWPRVAASCEFLSPVRFGDEVDVHLRVLRVGHSSLTMGYLLSHAGTPVARGRMTVVQTVLNAPGGARATSMPEELRSQLVEAPAEPAEAAARS